MSLWDEYAGVEKPPPSLPKLATLLSLKDDWQSSTNPDWMSLCHQARATTRRLKLATQTLRFHVKTRTGEAEVLLRQYYVNLTPGTLDSIRRTLGVGKEFPDQDCLVTAILGPRMTVPKDELEQGWIPPRRADQVVFSPEVLRELRPIRTRLQAQVGIGDWNVLQKMINEVMRCGALADQAYRATRAYLLSTVDIIAATTTFATIHRETLEMVGPRVLIMEEAAEVLDPLAVSAIPSGLQHLILLGDHQQLAPRLQNHLMARLGLGLSIMERLVMAGAPAVRLRFQNRMIPTLTPPLQLIYPDIRDGSGVKGLEPVRALPAPLYWWDHRGSETGQYRNEDEGLAVLELIGILARLGEEMSDIVVLAMYAEQVLHITALLKRPEHRSLSPVTVCTVDSFQGQESRVVILSTVRSNPERRAGFLKDPKRLCVSLSRARVALIVVGNVGMVESVPGWRETILLLQARKCVGTHFPFSCTVHGRALHSVADTKPRGGFIELLKCSCLCAVYA